VSEIIIKMKKLNTTLVVLEEYYFTLIIVKVDKNLQWPFK